MMTSLNHMAATRASAGIALASLASACSFTPSGVELDSSLDALIDASADASIDTFPDAGEYSFLPGCMVSCPGQATLIDDGLEDMNADGWTPAGGAISVPCGDAAEGNCYLRTTGGGESAYQAYASQTGIVMLRAYIRANGGGSGPGGLFLRSAPETGDAAYFQISGTGPGAMLFGGATAVGSFPGNEWHCLKAKVDVAGQRMDAQIDDAPVVADIPFAAPAPASLSSFDLVNNNNSTLDWDQLGLYRCD
jgi:hypothetical protein